MNIQQLFNQLLKDIKVELDDEFDRNFERKAFFNTAWKPAKHDTIGSLMMRTGALRKSLQSQIIHNNAIKWQSSLPYANIHNTGGTITVTPKMKGYFWYRYRMATGSTMFNNKKEVRKNKINQRLTTEALFWKTMALKKVGSQIHIPQRQFIGKHPVVHQTVKDVTDDWFNTDVKNFINNVLKKNEK